MAKKITEPEKNKKERLERESKNKNRLTQKKKISHAKSDVQTKRNWATDFDEKNFDEYYD